MTGRDPRLCRRPIRLACAVPRSVLAMGRSLRGLLLIGAALAGLFVMRGLSDHGSTGEHGMMLGEQHTTMSADPISHTIDAPVNPGLGAAAVGGCLAFLALLGKLLASRRAFRASPGASQVLTQLSFRPVFREPDPPHRPVLSVYRC